VTEVCPEEPLALARADRATCAAKTLGRNRVQAADELVGDGASRPPWQRQSSNPA